MSASDAQKQLQSLSDDYQRIQEDPQTSVTARQKLEAQQQENLGVQREFTNVKDSSSIYKLVGPVLLKQDKSDATMAVEGRLEYIGKEIKRVEQQIKEIQEKSEGKKMEVEIYDLQTQIRGQQDQAQVAA